MSSSITLIGSYLSPYVRKVLVCLAVKGIDYAIDPIAPFVGNATFGKLSPLRRIPVLCDGDFVLNDSSVICQYLEDTVPAPALYPADPRQRAQARWLEEFVDVALGDILAARMFFQLGVKRHLFGEATDEAVVAQARDVDLPQALDYLESQLPAGGFVFGALSIADISIASFLRMAVQLRYPLDPTRWPQLAGLTAQCWALPAFAELIALEDRIIRVPLAAQREVLASLGVRLTATSLGDAAPRRGPIAID